MDDSVRELLLIAGLILVNAFFAAAEIAIVSVRKTRLHQLVEEGVSEARLVQQLAESASRFLATIQVGVTLVGFFAAAIGAVSLAEPLYRLIVLLPLSIPPDTGHSLAVGAITLLLAFAMLVLGELVPKTLAMAHAERVSLLVARPIAFLAWAFTPAVALLSRTTELVLSLLGQKGKSTLPFITPEEIKTMVDAGEEGGAIEPTEKEMIYGVFEMSRTTAREVMVPRIDVFALEVNTPVPEVIRAAIRTAHTRIPVYEGTKDNIIGIVHVKDLLKCSLETCPAGGLREMLRPVYFVPESKKIDELLREMRAQRVHMAIVVDEYGGTAGLVTLEDLLEEIVGEIQDEYDREEASVQPLGEGEAIFDGITPLDDVNKMLDLDLQAEDVDSIGGYVYAQLGRIPVAGDTITRDGATVTVLATVGRRIKKVKVTKLLSSGVEEDKAVATT